MRKFLSVIGFCLFPVLAWGQSAVLQGGTPVAGHVPQYINSGNSQAIVTDGGGAVISCTVSYFTN